MVDPEPNLPMASPTTIKLLPTSPQDIVASSIDPLLPQSIKNEVLPGGYQIDQALGRGGYGAVYAGADLNLDRPVAIKLFTRDMDSQAAQRFRDEGRLLAKLQHPNIIQVYAFNYSEYLCPFLVMERFGDGSLKDYLNQEQTLLTLETSVHIIAQLLDALSAAHQIGVVHRDIKEANILYDYQTQRVKLCDFGIARAIERIEDQAQTTREGFVIGTHHYIAPERYRGSNHDARSDLYSVGVLLYRLLVGKRPFERYLGEVIPPAVIICRILEEELSGLSDKVPRAIERVCTKLLASDLTERYQDADSARQDLLEALASPETVSFEHELPPKVLHSASKAPAVHDPVHLPTDTLLANPLRVPSPHIGHAHPSSILNSKRLRRLIMITAFALGSLSFFLIWRYTSWIKPRSTPKVIRLGSSPNLSPEESQKGVPLKESPTPTIESSKLLQKTDAELESSSETDRLQKTSRTALDDREERSKSTPKQRQHSSRSNRSKKNKSNSQSTPPFVFPIKSNAK